MKYYLEYLGKLSKESLEPLKREELNRLKNNQLRSRRRPTRETVRLLFAGLTYPI